MHDLARCHSPCRQRAVGETCWAPDTEEKWIFGSSHTYPLFSPLDYGASSLGKGSGTGKRRKALADEGYIC